MATVASYRLPILSQSLPQAESIGQVVDVLGQLNNIVEQVFNKLRAKAELQKDRIDSITTRISSASQKAAILQKKTDSTVVISPASYPVRTISHYNPVFTPYTEPKVEPLQPIKQRKFASVEPERAGVPLDDSFATQTEQRAQYKKREEPQVVSVKSVDELIRFDEVKKQIRKIRKPTKPKTLKDIDPIVWEDFMSKVVKDPATRYIPVFQNFPISKYVPDHLMDTKIAKDVVLEEKISNDFVTPSMVLNLDLPSVGSDINSNLPDVGSDVNPKIQNDNQTPVQETPIAPVAPTTSSDIASLKPKEPETQKVPTPPPINLPPPTPIKKEDGIQKPLETKTLLPPPPTAPIKKPELPEPEITIKKEKPEPENKGAPSIPPPPPPPPMPKPVVIKVREPRQPKREPPRIPTAAEGDLHQELMSKILSRRFDISGEKDNKKEDDNEEWSDN